MARFLERKEFQDDLDETVRDSLPLACGILGVLFTLFALAHPMSVPEDIVLPMVALASGTVVAYFVMSYTLRRWPPPVRWAHPLAVVVAGLPLLNSSVHLALTQELRQSTNLGIIMIASSILFLSPVWFAGFTVLTLAASAILVTQLPPSDDTVHFTFFLVTSLAVAIVAFVIRYRSHGRLARERLSRIQTKAELEGAERHIAQSEKIYEYLVEHATDMVFRTDDQGFCVYLNPVAREVTGWKVDPSRHHYSEWVHPDSIDEVRAALNRHLEKKSDSFYMEFRALSVDGRELWIGQNIRYIWEGNRVVSADVLARDITRRIKEEEALRRNRDELEARVIARTMQLSKVEADLGEQIAERERAEEQILQLQKMEAVGRMAGGIAHDFNNLLTALIFSAEMLGSEREDDPLVQEHVDELQTLVERGKSLTRPLLAFSRKEPENPKSRDINEIVRNLEKMLARMLGNEIETSLHLCEDPAWVRCDAGRIDQVLLNLAVNAKDAMPQGGHFAIETAVTDAPAPAPGENTCSGASRCVQVRVTDSGTGMDASTAARIFEPFFTTKDVDRGTGLGLSTVYAIIQQTKGQILVESAPGRGTTFQIKFPLAPPPAVVSAKAADSGKTVVGSGVLLLAEDEESIRTSASALLTSHGFTVLTAKDGQDALDALRAHDGHIDMLITDLRMPRMGGEALAEIVLAEQPGTKVLYISGQSDGFRSPSDIDESTQQIIWKPFSIGELIDKVQEVLAES